MQLPNMELRAQLPALFSQQYILDPFVVGRLVSEFGEWRWYLIEGEQKGDEYVMFALVVVGLAVYWHRFPVSLFTFMQDWCGLRVRQDFGYYPRRLSLVRKDESIR